MAFRKRRVATPGFGHTPWNPIHGDQANLRQDGTAPYCAMMQIAAEDTHDDYVICRGFDPRILRFIDYAEGDANKPGISVAKPFGKRTPDTYQIAEVYPAFLPTQGNAGFADFRQVVFTPPSPVAVDWRVGQNPGVAPDGLEGGQPENLSNAINILYDDNGKVINWLLIDSNGGGGGGNIEYVIDSIETAESGPYTGLKIATVTVMGAPGGRVDLIGTSVEVVDHSRCIFDEDDMAGYTGWANERQYLSLDPYADCRTLTPLHWAADNRCCSPDTGLYAEPCEEP